MKNVLFRKSNERKKPSGKSGFTLIEVIVTLIITVIVIAISGSLVITGTNMFARSAQRDTQTNIAETVLTFVSEQILYAERIGVGTNENDNTIYAIPAANGAAIIHIKNTTTGYGDLRGQLFFRRADDGQPSLVNVFGENFYQGYDIGLTGVITKGPQNSNIELTVNVYSGVGNTPVMTRTITRPLLNYRFSGSETTMTIFDSENFYYFFVPGGN